MNIADNDHDPEIIRKNTQLQQYNTIFGDYSLFHYFAGDLEVIEMIHE